MRFLLLPWVAGGAPRLETVLGRSVRGLSMAWPVRSGRGVGRDLRRSRPFPRHRLPRGPLAVPKRGHVYHRHGVAKAHLRLSAASALSTNPHRTREEALGILELPWAQVKAALLGLWEKAEPWERLLGQGVTACDPPRPGEGAGVPETRPGDCRSARAPVLGSWVAVGASDNAKAVALCTDANPIGGGQVTLTRRKVRVEGPPD